jgi:hypothetical protein
MTTVVVEFDGKAFVPQRPISLPVGTRGTIAIPDSTSAFLAESGSANESDWQDILARIRAAEPESGTLEDTMREIRMRP